jgi:hypothetical protein
LIAGSRKINELFLDLTVDPPVKPQERNDGQKNEFLEAPLTKNEYFLIIWEILIMKKIILIAAIFFAVMFANTVFATGNTVNSGWVNVPVTDTKPFEVNCEYRIDSAPSKEGIHYAIHVAADRIETKYYSTGCFATMLYRACPK